MKKIFLWVCFFTLISLSNNSQAQRLNTRKFVTYNVSVPLGSSRDYISNLSFRGITLDIREMLGDAMSVGIAGSWHVFQNITYDTYEDGTVSISGKHYRTINTFPVMLTLHRYKGLQGEFQTFFGAGLGMQRINRTLELGPFFIQDKKWHFAFAPEVGIIYPVSQKFSLIASTKLHYAVKRSESEDLLYLSLNVGLEF